MAKSTGEKATRRIVNVRSGGDPERGICERCGRNGFWGVTVHHRLKRSQGGAWTPENCVVLCGHGTAGCHGWVEAEPNAAWAEGFHVRPWENPAERQVLTFRAGWVLLSESYRSPSDELVRTRIESKWRGGCGEQL